VSALSADTWSLFSIWSRNTLLNLVTLVAGIAALILFGRWVGLAGMAHVEWTARIGWLLPVFAVAALVVAAIMLAIALKEWRPRNFGIWNDTWVQRLVVLPAFAGAVLMTFQVYAHPIQDWVLGPILVPGWVWAGIGLSLLFFGLQLLAGFGRWFRHHPEKNSTRFFNWLLQPGVAAVSGFATSWLFYAVSCGVEHFKDKPFAPWLVLVVGPLGLKSGWSAFAAWTMTIVTLAWLGATVGSLLAAKSPKTGRDQGGGTMNLVALAGPCVFLLGFVSLIGLGVHQLTLGPVKTKTPEASVGASATAKVTQSGWTVTATFEKKVEVSSPWDRYWGEMQAQIPYTLPWNNSKDQGAVSWYKGLLDVMLLAVAITLVMAWRVDINEFSLHHFYKNRLVRCYLGAPREREDRKANPFTNFDPDDDFPLNHLDDANFSGPFPIINATLNLSSGRNLAWQERKGASFIFTPVYSGYDTGRDRSGTSASRHMRVGGDAEGGSARPGYYPTHLVAKTKHEREAAPTDGTARRFTYDGIKLGTTVAISGAAASPNRGYHRSTAVAFLMSVFNVQLGWWLGNPAGPEADSSGPTFGLGYTLAELFGTTSADSAFVNLSDGGHFDNMGLYELVRRKCRYIIVCDAEQDEEMRFGGLSAAIRMCRTDFGAEIAIDLSQFERKPDNKAEGFSGCHHAIGDIIYAERPPGRLVYLKSSLTGDEPADLLGYHKKVAQFPHESTADQWFGESQFECYRKLGCHIADQALAPLRKAQTRQKLFGAL
jgi:hypothetical protein